MKINKFTLNKIITVVCAALVAFTTIIYTAIPASAESWTDWASAPAAAQQLAQAYYEAWKTNDDKSVADYFSDWTDIPISWLKASTAFSSGYILNPVDDIIYYLDESNLLYKDVSRSGGGGRSRVGSSSDIVLDGETFADICKRLADTYAPQGLLQKVSWRSDARYSGVANSTVLLSFRNDGELFGYTNGVHALPFFYDGEKYYYGRYQFKYYTVSTWNEAETSVTDIGLYMDMTDNILEDAVATEFRVSEYNLIEYPYIDLPCRLFNNNFQPVFYATYANYIAKSNKKAVNIFPLTADGTSITDISNYICNDGSTTLTSTNWGNNLPYSTTLFPSYKLLDTNTADFGYILSDKPIDMSGYVPDDLADHIDPTYTVKFDGDNIYEYTIINEAGDSTTVNEYITNNYTIIEGDTIINEGDTIIDIEFGDFVLEIENAIEAAIENTILGEFLIKIGDTITTSIENTFNFFFVPDQMVIDDKISEIKLEFDKKLPFIDDIKDIFDTLIDDIKQQDIDRATVEMIPIPGQTGQYEMIYHYEYPKWTIDLDWHGQQMELVILDFYQFKDYLPMIRSIIVVFVYIAYVYNLVQYLPTLIGNVAGMANTVNTSIKED